MPVDLRCTFRRLSVNGVSLQSLFDALKNSRSSDHDGRGGACEDFEIGVAGRRFGDRCSWWLWDVHPTDAGSVRDLAHAGADRRRRFGV